MAEPGRRLEVSVIEFGPGDAQPGAVFQGDLQEMALRLRVIDERRVESERQDSRAFDFEGLLIDLKLDFPIVHPEEAAVNPVAVGEPDNLGRAGLDQDLVPAGIERRGVARRREDQAQDRIEGDLQLSQRLGTDLQVGVGRHADGRPHQTIPLGQNHGLGIFPGRGRQDGMARELDQPVERDRFLPGFADGHGDRIRVYCDDPSRGFLPIDPAAH